MKESLKFGPEWLRNTVAPAIDSNSVPSSGPRYALAEFRYGREEMLALFDKNSKLPEVYSKYKKLFVDKIQCPLALTPSTDDDVSEYQRSWSTRPPLGAGSIVSGGRGRGGSADRGRGRGRGFYSSTGYQRSTSLYDEEGRSLGRGERTWIERNGSGEPGASSEWAGGAGGPTTSPRKEYVRPGESWRRRGQEDEAPVNDWRSSGFSSRDKWGTNRSWREEDGAEGSPHAVSRSFSTPSNGIDRKSAPVGKKKPPSWDDSQDSLPEWATEDPSDYGGSFDATGAFHDSEDDDLRRFKQRTQSPKEEQKEKSLESSDEGETGSSSSEAEKKGEPASKPPEERPKENPEPEKPRAQEPSVDRMQEVADDMVAQLIMEDEVGVAFEGVVEAKAPSPLPQPQMGRQSRGPVAAEYWFYQDPKQKVQGPFSAQEMAEWYIAGYFDETLLVRRSCDSRFSTLGELLKICGGAVPFMSSHLIPAMVSPIIEPHPLLGLPPMDSEAQHRYHQLQMFQKQYLMRQQQAILQKLASSEPWALLSVEQQTAMLNHHMAQVQLPENLQSVSNMMTNLSPQQIALLQGDGGVVMQPKIPIPNHHVPSMSLQTQIRHHEAASATPLGQMMQQMSLSHLIGASNSSTSNKPHASPTPSHAESDPIKSLLMQLSMQKGAGLPQQVSPAPHKPANMSDSLLVNMWGAAPQTATSMQHLLSQPLNSVSTSQPSQFQMMMDERMEAAPMKKQQQQQPDWKGNQDPNLMGMWERGGPPVRENFHKTEQIPDEKSLMEQQEKMMYGNENSIETDMRVGQVSREEAKMAQKSEQGRDKKLGKKEEPKGASNNSKKKESKSDSKLAGTKKEAEKRASNNREKDKKRQQEENEKKRQQQLDDAKKKNVFEEKKRLDDIQERKAKLLEAQRRETVKIQEQQIQTQSRPATTMAPWSTAGVPSGPSLAEIEKIERQKRAEQLKMEQAMREQQEAHQMIQMQQQKDSILKWNSSVVKGQTVKSLAEIQAEEHAKQSAAERELTEKQQTLRQKSSKEQQDTITGASFWNASMQQSAWNTGKVWGSSSSHSFSTSNSTSGGGFWEEPITKTSQSNQKAAKSLSKSQTMGSISTNKSQAEKHQFQSKPANKVAANAASSSKVKGPKEKAVAPKEEINIGNEFTNWCHKTLINMKANVDVPTFVSFLQMLESPFEIKDYIRSYLGETKDCIEFSKQFLERRSKLKNQQRAQNAHIDDMCSPAPALTPNDFQEVKNKSKKVKKGKMTKIDNRILGFSVTAAPEHWNLEKNLDSSS